MLTTIVKGINRILLSVGIVALSGMMVLIAMDVFLRYLFNSPIPGAYELTEYLMAILVPFSIAYCAEEKRHVAVDFVYERFSVRIRGALDFVVSIVTMAFLAIMVWQSVLHVGEVYASGLTSAVLLIPAYPFVVPISIGLAVFTLLLCVQLVESMRKADQR